MTRTGNSLKNSALAMIYYFISLLLQFFSRKIFLDYLGTEVLGLNTTASNLLQFLNLAELGISAAVGFTLYKPLHENDGNSVNEIVSLQGHLYKRIGLIVIAGAVILMAFFPLIFEKMKLPLWYAYATFGVLLLGAMLGYFVNYRQIVLSASQQDYKILYSYKTVNLVKILIQMWAVYTFADGYVWWIILEGLGSIASSIALTATTRKSFPNLRKSSLTFKQLRIKYPEFTVKIKQLFFHKIGSFALTQTAPLIIYAYTALTIVALYGNYLVVFSGLTVLGGQLFNSVNASVGDLAAEGNKEKSYRVFCELFSVRFLIVTTLCFIAYELTPRFIMLWIGKEYLLPTSTLLLMIATLYINTLRYAVDAFINAYGIFHDIWAPATEAALNIGISILLGYYYGLNGVIAGVLISQVLIIVIWKPILLFTTAFKGKLFAYVRLYALHVLAISIALICTLAILHLIPEFQMTLTGFLLKALTSTFVYGFCAILSLLIFRTPIRHFFHRLKGFAKR